MKLVVRPFATVAGAGVTAMLASALAVTVRVALVEVILLDVAVTDVTPCFSVAAMPLAFIVATVVSLEAQVVWLVISVVVLFE
jgi:hypothetical protein